MKSYWSDRTRSDWWDFILNNKVDMLSSTRKCARTPVCGVPQGSVLGLLYVEFHKEVWWDTCMWSSTRKCAGTPACGVPQGSVMGFLHVEFHKEVCWDSCMWSSTRKCAGTIIRSHNIQYDIYADDTQLYILFDLKNPSASINKLKSCIYDVRWSTTKWKLMIIKRNF